MSKCVNPDNTRFPKDCRIRIQGTPVMVVYRHKGSICIDPLKPLRTIDFVTEGLG